MRIRAILIVVGASGSGKTSAVRALEKRSLPGVSCHYFDKNGVPSFEQMKREYGSWNVWMVTMTERWLERLASGDNVTEVSVLEGGANPSDVFSLARRMGLPVVRVVLMDCSHEVRNERLRGPRRQPELANPSNDCWAAYLRGQADALTLPVIDGSEMGIESVTDQLAILVETVRDELRLAGKLACQESCHGEVTPAADTNSGRESEAKE